MRCFETPDLRSGGFKVDQDPTDTGVLSWGFYGKSRRDSPSDQVTVHCDDNGCI